MFHGSDAQGTIIDKPADTRREAVMDVLADIVIDETITIVALLGSALILSGVYIAERGVNLKK